MLRFSDFFFLDPKKKKTAWTSTVTQNSFKYKHVVNIEDLYKHIMPSEICNNLSFNVYHFDANILYVLVKLKGLSPYLFPRRPLSPLMLYELP